MYVRPSKTNIFPVFLPYVAKRVSIFSMSQEEDEKNLHFTIFDWLIHT